MNQAFLKRLDIARGMAGTSFKINSGYRCKKHNDSIAGASPTSSHLKGVAVDIACTNSAKRYLILRGLINAGFSRIGIDRNFIHVDEDCEKDQNVIWRY